jgi:hypothetical protein
MITRKQATIAWWALIALCVVVVVVTPGLLIVWKLVDIGLFVFLGAFLHRYLKRI